MTHPEDKEGSKGERQAKGRKEQYADDKVEPRRLGSTFQNYGRSGKLIEGEYGYGRTWK